LIYRIILFNIDIIEGKEIIKKKLSNDIFSILENNIFSMGQSCLSAVNLLVECIELSNINAYKLIDNLEKELDSDQKSIDYDCFSLLNKYRITYEQGKYIFGFLKNAESFERIGDLCINISNKIKQIDFIKEDNNYLILFSQYIKIILTNSIVSLNEKKLINIDIFFYFEKIKELKKSIILKSKEQMHKKRELIPYIIEYISISKNLEKISKLSYSITENIKLYLQE
jgi:phosphate uptake regulator